MLAFYQEIYRFVVPISFLFIFNLFQFYQGLRNYGGGTEWISSMIAESKDSRKTKFSWRKAWGRL
jgi:hypothetical protein